MGNDSEDLSRMRMRRRKFLEKATKQEIEMELSCGRKESDEMRRLLIETLENKGLKASVEELKKELNLNTDKVKRIFLVIKKLMKY